MTTVRTLGAPMRALFFAALALAAVSALPACATYREQLGRARKAYDAKDNERALALMRDLEPDMLQLKSGERVKYAFLRGMADYRIGYKRDARHWLALAKAMDEETPGALSEDWKRVLETTSTELESTVYEKGLSGLSNTVAAGADDGAPARADVEAPRQEKKAKPAADEP